MSDFGERPTGRLVLPTRPKVVLGDTPKPPGKVAPPPCRSPVSNESKRVGFASVATEGLDAALSRGLSPIVKPKIHLEMTSRSGNGHSCSAAVSTWSARKVGQPRGRYTASIHWRRGPSIIAMACAIMVIDASQSGLLGLRAGHRRSYANRLQRFTVVKRGSGAMPWWLTDKVGTIRIRQISIFGYRAHWRFSIFTFTRSKAAATAA